MAWLGTWVHRIEITPDYTNFIGASVTWYPIDIKIESGLAGVGDKDVSCIFDELTSDENRKKIAVTQKDGTTELYVEIEQWDDTGENAVLHCSLDGWTIDNDDDVVFIYYDSAHADNDAHVADLGSRTEVWDGDYEMVLHMVDANIEEQYLTSWTKSGENPLQDKACQNWLCACYSNYGDEDKIYIFEQRSAAPSKVISCWSVPRVHADDPTEWTDEGTIYTGANTWDENHVEPHGISFETQAMADAREEVGEGEGTRKWRLYYCGNPSAPANLYDAGFLTAPESDLTDWTYYAGNPVITHDATYGYPDNKVCIFEDEVYMMMGCYTTPGGWQHSRFIKSANGIDGWVTIRDNISDILLTSTLTPMPGGILTHARLSPGYDEYNGLFFNSRGGRASYSGNPIMEGGAAQWDDMLAWQSIVLDKDGSYDLDGLGTYYWYYIGYTDTTFKLGLATSTTETEESEASDVLLDSTSNENDVLKVSATEPTEATGQIYKGQDFDGSEWLDAGDIDIDGNGTIEAWVKTTKETDIQTVLLKTSAAGDAKYADLSMRIYTGDLGVLIGDNTNYQASTSSLAVSQDNWHYVAISVDGTYINFRVDANTEQDNQTHTPTGNAYKYSVGRYGEYDGHYFLGIIDEVRLSSTDRSAAWKLASYHSGLDDLLTYGDEKTYGVGWTGKIIGVTDPSKILGVAVADISKVMGVA